MEDKSYYSINDIAKRWGIARRTVERIIADGDDPHPLIVRKFGGNLRVHQDDLLDYEEHHIVSERRSTGKRSAGRQNTGRRGAGSRRNRKKEAVTMT